MNSQMCLFLLLITFSIVKAAFSNRMQFEMFVFPHFPHKLNRKTQFSSMIKQIRMVWTIEICLPQIMGMTSINSWFIFFLYLYFFDYRWQQSIFRINLLKMIQTQKLIEKKYLAMISTLEIFFIWFYYFPSNEWTWTQWNVNIQSMFGLVQTIEIMVFFLFFLFFSIQIKWIKTSFYVRILRVYCKSITQLLEHSGSNVFILGNHIFFFEPVSMGNDESRSIFSYWMLAPKQCKFHGGHKMVDSIQNIWFKKSSN